MNKYNKIFLLSVTLLIFVSAILSAVTISLGFRISEVIYKEGSTKESFEFYEPQLKIKFNIPVKEYDLESDGASLTDFISVDPQVEFTTTKFGSELNLNFRTNLESNTKYTVTFDSDLENIYGDSLGKTTTFSFTTRVNSFSYIKKSENRTNDKIQTVSLDNLDSEFTYLELPNITKFTENGNFVAAVTRDLNNFDEIAVYIKDSKEIQYLNLENLNVRNLKFVPRTNSLVFSAFPVKRDGQFTLPTGSTELYKIDNLEESAEIEKIDLSNHINDIGEFFFSSDGSVLLVKDVAVAEYFLFNYFNFDDLISIGRQLQSGGFNRNNNQIVFINFDALAGDATVPYISIYDSSRELNNINETRDYNIDPQFFYNSEDVIFAQKASEFANTKGIFRIVTYNQDFESVVIFEDSEFSFELPKLSPDDNFLIFEKYSKNQIQNFENTRSYEFQNKPEFGNLVLLDLETKQVKKEITNSVEVLWHTFE